MQSAALEVLRSRPQRTCLQQAAGVEASRGPFQPQPFCSSSVLFLTLLGAYTSTADQKHSVEAGWVFPAVRSLVNTHRTYQLSTLCLAKLNPVFGGSPPALYGHKQEQGPTFPCTFLSALGNVMHCQMECPAGRFAPLASRAGPLNAFFIQLC